MSVRRLTLRQCCRNDLKLFELLTKHLWIWELFFEEFRQSASNLSESSYTSPFIDFFGRLVKPIIEFFKRKPRLPTPADLRRVACTANLMHCLDMMRVLSLDLSLAASCLPRLRGKDIASIVQMCRDSMFGHPSVDQDRRLKLILKSNIGTLHDEDLFRV
jgi:hypothetical protein